MSLLIGLNWSKIKLINNLFLLATHNMDLEYGVKRWPQQSNYRTNLEFLSSCSYSRMTKPKPLDPKYYERHAKVKAVEDALNKELEIVMAKVAKAEADMTAADASISQNKWSKAAAKLTNSQRLKNVLI